MVPTSVLVSHWRSWSPTTTADRKDSLWETIIKSAQLDVSVANPMTIVRDTSVADMLALQEIYAVEVLSGLASFEEIPPSASEMTERFEAIQRLALPYLTAELAGEVVGFAYASRYRPRPSYRYTVENSVYVAASARGQGVGRALLQGLICRCEGLGFRQMIAVIGDSANGGSITLHRKLGFEQIGTLHAVGFKLGRWVDTVLMQRALGAAR